MTVATAPILVCAGAVALLLVGERRDARALAGAAKLVAAATFLWAALELGALDSRYGRFVLTGLALSAAGDALLIRRGQGLSFQLGIAAFLIGHVAYAFAFAGLALNFAALGLATIAMLAVSAATLRWLRPSVPDALRVAVIAYVIVISVMVVLALGATFGGARAGVAVGGLAFAVSDVSVARDRFVAPGFANAAWGLPLYFFAQHVLATTVT